MVVSELVIQIRIRQINSDPDGSGSATELVMFYAPEEVFSDLSHNCTASFAVEPANPLIRLWAPPRESTLGCRVSISHTILAKFTCF